MKSHISHLVFGINPDNAAFYKDLMTFLGWHVLYDAPGMLGLADGGKTSIWFGARTKEVTNDYDGPGLNHVAIGVGSQADVDATVAYLQAQGVPALFETPRHRAEFAYSPSDTYYQVMFESPDRILVEVVYQGPKA
ncbi:MAG: VOC family protein [Anaerolineae bacterium]|nr:VOC family protein [Anaerolineae bacterium]